MKPMDTLELHREAYERRQRELELREPPRRGKEHALERLPSVDRDAGRHQRIHRNGHK